jgi:hypothetical protein
MTGFVYSENRKVGYIETQPSVTGKAGDGDWDFVQRVYDSGEGTMARQDKMSKREILLSSTLKKLTFSN